MCCRNDGESAFEALNLAMFSQPDVSLQRAAELAKLPPKGQPYSVPIPGSEAPGRSKVYRHWMFADKPLLERLDDKVR